VPCNEEKERKGKIEDPSGRDFSATKKQGEVVALQRGTSEGILLSKVRGKSLRFYAKPIWVYALNLFK
jgi:hypothetical protein